MSKLDGAVSESQNLLRETAERCPQAAHAIEAHLDYAPLFPIRRLVIEPTLLLRVDSLGNEWLVPRA